MAGNTFRVRFGVKLNIPFLKNAGVFVAYITQAQYDQANQAVYVLNLIFPMANLFLEKSD